MPVWFQPYLHAFSYYDELGGGGFDSLGALGAFNAAVAADRADRAAQREERIPMLIYAGRRPAASGAYLGDLAATKYIPGLSKRFRARLKTFATRLKKYGVPRDALRAAVVTSATRDAESNAATGGVAGSYHLSGDAVDVQRGFADTGQLDAAGAKAKLQVILYDNHVHIEWAEKGQPYGVRGIEPTGYVPAPPAGHGSAVLF